MEAKAKLPNPHGVLVVITTVFGAILGSIGGALRGRRERSEEARAAIA